MATYEFFKKKFEFRGKHARMAEELWKLNDYEHTYFKRLIDLYIISAVIGFRIDRSAEEDYSPVEPKSIFPEQMINAKEDLDFIMESMIMLSNGGRLSDEECVKLAFRGAQTDKEFQRYQEMFNGYVRGGVEELYERIIVRKAEPDDAFQDNKVSNLVELMKRFGQKRI